MPIRPSDSTSLAIESGNPGDPTSTRWQPISSVGFSFASRTASSNASPVAMIVAAVRMPLRCASTIPSFTSRVKPKSSAFTTSLRMKIQPKLRAGTLEQSQFNMQKFLWVRAEILKQPMQLAGGAVERLIKRRIVHQQPDGSLAAVDFIKQRIHPLQRRAQLIMQIAVVHQRADRSLSRIDGVDGPLNSRDRFSQIADGGAGVVIHGRVFDQLADRALSLLDSIHQRSHARQSAAQIIVERVIVDQFR